jgi:hypothetical protein
VTNTDRERRTTDRMRQLVDAGRVTAELLVALGLHGSPGFMGRGSFATSNRTAGYQRRGTR